MEATSPERPPSDAEEVELWWGAYAGRTMAPGFVVCGVLTGTILVLAWLATPWVGSDFLHHAAQVVIGALWIWQAGRWAYRQVAINYRLTTRRLFVDHGFFRPANHALDLRQIREVTVLPGPWPQLFRVGRLRVLMNEPNSAPLLLEGVRDPEQVALKIRNQVRRRSEAHEPRKK
jgi:hypothetical protein